VKAATVDRRAKGAVTVIVAADATATAARVVKGAVVDATVALAVKAAIEARGASAKAARVRAPSPSSHPRS
jgi:hypothetical protein